MRKGDMGMWEGDVGMWKGTWEREIWDGGGDMGKGDMGRGEGDMGKGEGDMGMGEGDMGKRNMRMGDMRAGKWGKRPNWTELNCGIPTHQGSIVSGTLRTPPTLWTIFILLISHVLWLLPHPLHVPTYFFLSCSHSPSSYTPPGCCVPSSYPHL